MAKGGSLFTFNFESGDAAPFFVVIDIKEECVFMGRSTSGVKSQDPKMNLTFYDKHLAFCKAMAGKKHLSVTQYVNGLISEEMQKHERSEWCDEDGVGSLVSD